MTLYDSLSAFRDKANTSPRVQRIAAGWNQRLYVECTDSAQRLCLDVCDGALSPVSQAGPGGDGLLIRGTEDLLTSMFNGQVHPLGAYNDGLLEVYGDQRDQVKLDAISLVVWGA